MRSARRPNAQGRDRTRQDGTAGPDPARSRPARHAAATTCCANGGTRAWTLPIVILSSRTDEAGIVKALELGADDYVTKPFGMNELVARIRVALRHRLQQQGEKPIFQTGDLSVDLVKRIVKVDGQGDQAVAEGIRHPAHSRAARRQGSDPPVPAEAGLGRFDRRAISAGSMCGSSGRRSKRRPTSRDTSPPRPASATGCAKSTEARAAALRSRPGPPNRSPISNVEADFSSVIRIECHVGQTRRGSSIPTAGRASTISRLLRLIQRSTTKRPGCTAKPT